MKNVLPTDGGHFGRHDLGRLVGNQRPSRSRNCSHVFSLRFDPRSVPFFFVLLLPSLLATTGTDHVSSLLLSPLLIELIHGKLDVLGICADFLFARAALEQRVCCSSLSYVVVVGCVILVPKRHSKKKPQTASSFSVRSRCIGRVWVCSYIGRGKENFCGLH